LGLGDKSAGPGAGIWVLAACICWGLDNNLTSLIDSISPARSTFWKGLIAGLINLGLGTAVGNQIGTLTAVGLALLVGALAYGASIALYISAAQNIGASRAQMFFASSPFFGVALAALALGESVSLVQTAAGAIIAVSLILVFSDKHEHDHSHVESDHEHSHSHDDSHHSHDHAGEEKSGVHSHPHRHDAIRHSHAHWPDLHHRHPHDDKR
jgi:drug/metabolite transporter (DMT)-like permease